MDWLEFENKAIARGFSSVCGVDEAGRGPLAGPVCAAAVILPPGRIIEGVNDSESCAQELAALLHGKNAHVNLIPVNPIREREYRAPDRAAALRFQKRLENLGINATIRRKMGADIDSACGQLRLRAKAEQGE